MGLSRTRVWVLPAGNFLTLIARGQEKSKNTFSTYRQYFSTYFDNIFRLVSTKFFDKIFRHFINSTIFYNFFKQLDLQALLSCVLALLSVSGCIEYKVIKEHIQNNFINNVSNILCILLLYGTRYLLSTDLRHAVTIG